MPKKAKRRKGKAKDPLAMKPAQRFARKVAVDKLLEKAPKAVDEVRASGAAEVVRQATIAHDIPEGMMEIEIKDTHLRLLGMRNQSAAPTLEQRVAIARRLNEVGPSLPRYVKEIVKSTTSIGEAEMGKSKSNPAGLDVKEIEKAHAENRKEVEAEEKRKAAEAKVKAKADEAKAAAEAKARKKLKHADVTPKPEHHSKKPEAPARARDSDPKAQVKGVSAPPVKKSAGMKPGDVPKGGFTAQNKPSTSGELIRARIFEQKMTDDAIASEVRKLWPGRTTGVSDVRWNRSQMQKAGIKNVPEPVEGSTVPGKKK